MYNEDDFLMLSGIQHFCFCKRQWALIHLEQYWNDNVRTIQGNILHENAHDSSSHEKRKGLIISRGMAIHSSSLGISGECDVVEFHKSKDGTTISGYDGLYDVIPVEYKKGSPKSQTDADIYQLVAQAICLEEMLCCDIPKGYLFYGETKHRLEVEITPILKSKVTSMVDEMHKYYDKKFTPKVKRTKSCNACSLADTCLPMLNKSISVKEYLNDCLKER